MTVTANYVLVNDKGQVVQSKTSNGMVDTYLSTNMVTTGDMGAEVVGDWRSVGLDGTISATSQASAVKNFDGYKLVDKEGVWSSTPLTFDFDADGDGKRRPCSTNFR